VVVVVGEGLVLAEADEVLKVDKGDDADEDVEALVIWDTGDEVEGEDDLGTAKKTPTPAMIIITTTITATATRDIPYTDLEEPMNLAITDPGIQDGYLFLVTVTHA
jgi:hypothetical protein